MRKPIAYETLGDLVDKGVACRPIAKKCQRFRPFDIEQLIAKVGRDWRFLRRRWPIKCAVSGSGLSVQITGDQRGPGESKVHG